MKKNKILLLLSLMVMMSHLSAQTTFRTDNFQVGLSPVGEVISLSDTGSGENYVPSNDPGSLLRIKSGGVEYQPIAMEVRGSLLLLKFEKEIEVHVEAKQTREYVRFEVVNIVHPEKIEVIFWGPFNTTIDETIGEVVGVVRDSDFAIGLRALNIKTIGGKLTNSEGTTLTTASGRGSTATKEDHGSSLQAFSINQALDRKINVWLHQNEYRVKGLPDYTLEGIAIALFGTSPGKALQTIGQINISEGLPYQVIDGEWIRTSKTTGKPYLITSFSEENFDEILEFAERLGFYSIYHSAPFQNWGQFDLRTDLFPNGLSGMRAIVEKAKERNIRIGVHTLTNFITTDDPFVTTHLNSNLMDAGYAILTEDISKDATTIIVDDYKSFEHKYTLNSIRIGNEIIRYQEVTREKPYTLINCVRGAFGTTASSHKRGIQVKKLIDYPYNTFFPDWEMQEQMINNLAEFFNETGVSHMDFDGHEGVFITGHGDYAANYFADEFLNRVNHLVVNGSSIINHYYWNNNSYINWGEPWYASFRESQSEHRFSLQPFFERNYMHNMLGWFLMTPDTSVEDIEWMMARAAGFNAGYAFVANYEALKENPFTDQIIERIRIWEEAKELSIFSDEQIIGLKNQEEDFHLEKIGANQWRLNHFERLHFEHRKAILQPGQPTHSTFTFVNEYDPQPIHLQLLIAGDDGARVENIKIVVDGFFDVSVSETLNKGQTLVWDGSEQMRLYSDRGRFIKSIDIGKSLPDLRKGSHQITIDAGRMVGNEPVVRGIVRLQGAYEVIEL